MKQLDKIERLLEYSYLSNNYLHCMQQLQANTQKLKRTPGNVMIMGENERIKKDMESISMVMSNIQKQLLENFEDENEIQFHYLIKRNAAGKVNGQTMEVNKTEEEK